MNKRVLRITCCLLAVGMLAGCKKYEGDDSLPSALPLPSMEVSEGVDTTPDPNVPVDLQDLFNQGPTDSSRPEGTPDGIPDPKETPMPEDMTYDKDYKRYADANSDVVGWIDVPNTNIHYPVAIGNDNEYYLLRNYAKQNSKSGTIFMDYRNKEASGWGHLILYGHKMKNGTMFAELDSYGTESFFKKNTKITFYWNGQKTEWEVFSAYTASGSSLDKTSDEYIIRAKFKSSAEIEEYAKLLKAKSKFESKVSVSGIDQILSLVTCAYEYDQKLRFVVHARRIMK